MSKIKAIQKGTGEEAIWFAVAKNEAERSSKHYVDEISQVLVDKEFKLDEYRNFVVTTQCYEYHLFKEGKLVCVMTNDNLTIWYE